MEASKFSAGTQSLRIIWRERQTGKRRALDMPGLIFQRISRKEQVDLICGTQVLHTNDDPDICAEIIALTSPLDETLGR